MKAIILAGGKGTRLDEKDNPMPKVLRKACNKPLLGYVIDSISYIDNQDIMLVVGYMYEEVINTFPNYRFIKQGGDGYGTGYALKCGYEALGIGGHDGDIMVLQGDTPLVKSETLIKMCDEQKKQNNSCTLLSCVSQRSLPFGRIVRTDKGMVNKIVEEKNCTPEQKLIRELNVGMYIFNSKDLKTALDKMKVNPISNEYYLTDIIEILYDDNKRVGAYITGDETEMWGVNTLEDLMAVEEILKNRK